MKKGLAQFEGPAAASALNSVPPSSLRRCIHTRIVFTQPSMNGYKASISNPNADSNLHDIMVLIKQGKYSKHMFCAFHLKLATLMCWA